MIFLTPREFAMERTSILKFLLLTFPILSGGPRGLSYRGINPRSPAVEPFFCLIFEKRVLSTHSKSHAISMALDSVAFRGDARSSGFSPFNLSREELACLRTTAHAGWIRNSQSLLHAYYKTLHIRVALPVLV
ncbi:hypothetical protein EDD16DRAFT_1552706 [Pisolithus croceorrhizus]|nr:hypothetical protein EDD16DRAFT_1552706 [Pisolithus croceorrhizus]